MSESKAISVCNSLYKKVLDAYSKVSGHKIVLSHFGEFSQDLVNSLSKGIEDIMINSDDAKGPVKRMFSILVEGLQNVRIHAEKDEDGAQVAFLVVAQHEEYYRVAIGNLILVENIEYVLEKIDNLNKMTPEEVKAHYMEILTNGIISNKGGAGLGFITIAMKSKSTISYEIEDIDGKISCFSYSVELKRKK